MTGQSTAAAERSFHEPATNGAEPACHVCGGPWRKGGASYAARVLPPLVQVCSAECAAAPAFAIEKTRARYPATTTRARPDRDMTTGGEAEAWRAGWGEARAEMQTRMAILRAEYLRDGFPRDAEAIANMIDTIRAMEPPA